ncbi:hypothetical protein [Desulfobacter sp.]|uniref:hypothetical protein n=1 Tax=Desulfobacter sp. TaxID=2294 RepID=UPI003D0F6262
MDNDIGNAHPLNPFDNARCSFFGWYFNLFTANKPVINQKQLIMIALPEIWAEQTIRNRYGNFIHPDIFYSTKLPVDETGK